MWYWIFRAVFILVLKSAFRLKAEGLDNVPRKSNFIIVANHPSYLDPLAVMAVVPRKIHCISLKSLYRVAWLRWFLTRVEAIPSGHASERMVELVMKGENVGLFPEGGLSRDGKLREFRRGVALLALKTGRPIVPCAILGSYQALPWGAKFPRFRQIRVKIGKPHYLLKEFTEVIDDIYLQEGIFKVRNSIKEMLDAG